MTAPMNPLRLDEEARLDLQAAAADRERRNRPLWPVFLGIGLIVAAGVYLLSAWSSYSDARGRLLAERELFTTERSLASQITAANAARSDPALLERLAPDSNVVTRLEALAVEVGLSGLQFSNESDNVGAKQQGLERKRFESNFKDQRVASLLAFLQRSGEVSRGLELRRVTISGTVGGPPDAEGKPTVSGVVGFTRWERPARASSGGR